jgi:hypothetical protein
MGESVGCKVGMHTVQLGYKKRHRRIITAHTLTSTDIQDVVRLCKAEASILHTLLRPNDRSRDFSNDHAKKG